jgi:autotransporter-associated beta strand protein
LAATPGPSVYGQSETFTASVTCNGAAVSGGSVDFREGSTVLASAVPVDINGHASFSTATLSAAASPHAITAYYSGLSLYLTSSGATSQVVAPAPITVTADHKSRSYGSVNPILTASYSGFVNDETASVLSGSPDLSTAVTATSPVGSYAIVTGLGSLSAANYSFRPIDGTLNVTAAPLSVTSDDQTKTYGNPFTAFTGTIVGLMNGDDITASYASNGSAADAAVTASPYPIDVVLNDPGSKLSNYVLTDNVGNLTVARAPLVVTAGDKTRAYGMANPALTASYSGFVNGDGESVLSGNADFSTDAAIGSAPGSYPIGVSAGTLAADNYDFSFVPGNLTVTRANTQTGLVSSDNPSVQGQAVTYLATIVPASGSNPSGSVDFQIDGSSSGDPIIVSDGAASFQTPTLPLGNHVIVATYGGDANFNGSTSTAIDQTVYGLPTAQPGGPYTIGAGMDLHLDASGSTDPNGFAGGHIVEYAWDLDHNGQYEIAGPSPTADIAWSALSSLGEGTHTIGFRVTDSLGLTAASTATLDIHEATLPVTPANDIVRIACDPVNAGSVQVFLDGGNSPAYSVVLSQIGQWQFPGGAGDDTLIVDFSQGDPLPSGGLNFAGASSNAGSVLQIVGSSGNDSVVLKSDRVSVAGAADILYQNVSRFAFQLGGGLDSLSIDGAQMLAASAHSISASTAVTVINGGVVDMGGTSATVRGLALVDGSVVNGALAASQAYQFQSGTISAALQGAIGLVKSSTGLALLSGDNTYSGVTQVNDGTLVIEKDNGATSYTANSGGTAQFNAAVFNLGNRTIAANAGGTVQYVNASIVTGYLAGPGIHTTLPAAASSFNAVTIKAGVPFLQNGPATFTNVANYGSVTNNSPLTWDAGINAASGSLTVNSTVATNEFTTGGAITINAGGAIGNSLTNLTAYNGARLTVNSGGTLNVDSQNEGLTLDLQDALLVNDGTVTGTTNVFYGGEVRGSGTFGPINVFDGGVLDVSPGATIAAPGVTLSSGNISGAGQLAVPVAIQSAAVVTAQAGEQLVLSGAIEGNGALTKLGAGAVVLAGSGGFAGGMTVSAGTLVIATPTAVADGSSLTVGAGAVFDTSMASASVVAAAISPPSAAAAPSATCGNEPSTLGIRAIDAATVRGYAAIPTWLSSDLNLWWAQKPSETCVPSLQALDAVFAAYGK